jgi:CXXC-20-CXXC protein
MKTRTCPYCNYKYSFGDYVSSLLFKLIWDEWNCKKCSNLITFNARRRLWVSLCFGVWIVIILSLKDRFIVTPLIWIFTILLLIGGSIMIFTFDTFEKAVRE